MDGNDTGEKSGGSSGSIARWKKPKTSIFDLASKILRWARSIKQYHCSADAENQVMSSTVAPTQSASTSQSPKNIVVPTADLLNTGGVDSIPTSDQNNSTIVAQDDDNDDDENAARFLS